MSAILRLYVHVFNSRILVGTAAALSLLAPATTQAAIEVSPAVSTCETATSDTVTIADVSVGSEPNRILIVGVGAEDQDGDCALDDAGASASYGGQEMTLAAATQSDLVKWRNCAALFYLLAPATGTADVTVVFRGKVRNRQAGAFVISNAAQQAPEAVATAGDISMADPTTTAIATLSSGALVVDAISQAETGAFATTEAGQASIWVESCGSSSAAGSSKPAGSPGSTDMGWSHPEPRRHAHVLAAFASAAEPLACEVTLALTNDVTIGALQVSVDYAGAPGDFVGTGSTVACRNDADLPIGFPTFFDDDAERTLGASYVAVGGISGPQALATCDFEPEAGSAFAADFAVEVVDAVGTDLQPVPAEVEASISCLSCGQPVGAGRYPLASDCLASLLFAVGIGSPCDAAPCLCDVNSSGTTTASDSLTCLQATLDETVPLVCSCDLEAVCQAPAPEDFVVTIIDATDPDGFPVATPNVEVSITKIAACRYDVQIDLTDMVTLGAFQYDVDYAAAPGEFAGSAAQVECSSPLAGTGAFVTIQDDDATSTLRAGMIAFTGFNGPVTTAVCKFDAAP